MKEKNIKDLLKEGMSAQDILKDVQAQIKEAQDELDKDNAKEKNLHLKRGNMVNAIMEYMEALGYKEETSEIRELIYKELAKLEKKDSFYGRMLEKVINEAKSPKSQNYSLADRKEDERALRRLFDYMWFF